MNRVTTGFCVAATLGCIATLGAQTSTPPTSTGAAQRAPMADKARDVTITGCLSKGADGKFVLTNARIDNPTTTTGTSGTTATTPPATAATPGTTTATAGANAAAMSWALTGGTDLDKHVGHQIQVTGRTGWEATMDHAKMPDTTAAAAGTAAGTVGTSGTTTTATVEEMRKDMHADQPKLDVQSVKMIAPSCS